MDYETVFYLLAVLVTGVASILAWVSKIRWANQYKEATGRALEAKDAEIEALKTRAANLEALTSDVFLAKAKETKMGLEAVIAENQEELDDARHRIEQLQIELEQVEEAGREGVVQEDEVATLNYDALVERIRDDLTEAETARKELERNRLELRALHLEGAPEFVRRFRANVDAVERELAEVEEEIAEAEDEWAKQQKQSAADFNEARGKLIALKGWIESVEGQPDGANCPLCDRPVNGPQSEILEQLRSEWEAMVANALQHKKAVADAVNRPPELERLFERHGELLNNLQRERQRLVRSEMAVEELAKIQEDLNALQRAEQ